MSRIQAPGLSNPIIRTFQLTDTDALARLLLDAPANGERLGQSRGARDELIETLPSDGDLHISELNGISMERCFQINISVFHPVDDSPR